MNEKGFVTNRSGGIQGGISNGETIVARLAVKPTPSIRKTQRTVDTSGRRRIIAIRGRHDPCIAPRVVPVAEAMTAVVLLDALLRQLAISNAEQDVESLRFLIDGCDDLIVESLARRLTLARRIGELKKDRKLAVRDAGREKDVLARTAGLAEELDLPRKDVARLFKEIMAMSKAAQKTVKKAAK